MNQYLAIGVRLARSDESANCRIMLDWEYAKYPATEQVYEHRFVLVSTCKTEKGHEGRLDGAFTERNALDEDSFEEEEEEPARTRPKRTPGGGFRSRRNTGNHEYMERVVTSCWESRLRTSGEPAYA